jgi:hypothetical protein
MATNTRTVILQRGEEEQLQLAVNPKNMVISQPQNTMRYVTIRGDTVHVARGGGLTQVTLATFLPSTGSRFYQGVTPIQALAMLQRWMEAGEPIRLLISGSELGELFLVCGLEQTLTEGDTDVGIRIQLKEYKFVTLAEPDILEGENAGGLYLRADERVLPTVYVTVGGEDLWTIARLYLGDGSRWQELAVRNGIADPHNLPAGKELYLQ